MAKGSDGKDMNGTCLQAVASPAASWSWFFRFSWLLCFILPDQVFTVEAPNLADKVNASNANLDASDAMLSSPVYNHDLHTKWISFCVLGLNSR